MREKILFCRGFFMASPDSEIAIKASTDVSEKTSSREGGDDFLSTNFEQQANFEEQANKEIKRIEEENKKRQQEENEKKIGKISEKFGNTDSIRNYFKSLQSKNSNYYEEFSELFLSEKNDKYSPLKQSRKWENYPNEDSSPEMEQKRNQYLRGILESFQKNADALKEGNLSDQQKQNIEKDQIQKIARCFDQWKRGKSEFLRWDIDGTRVENKKSDFFSKYLDLKYPDRTSKERQQEEKTLKNEYEAIIQAGSLTVEVFLDKTYPLLNDSLASHSLLDLYKQWESNEIQSLAQKTKTIEEFENILTLSSSNNKSLKDKAWIEKEKLWDQNLSEEELKNKISEIDKKWHTEATQKFSMLNREEIIKTAFFDLKPVDYKGGSLFIKKIQIIGKYYYNDEKISTEGAWGPQTEGILLTLRKDNAFEAYWNHIDAALKANKSYGEKAQSFSKKLIENQVPGAFDKVSRDSHRSYLKNREEGRREAGIRKMGGSENNKGKREIIREEKNKNLEQSLENLTDEEIDLSIPKDFYLQAISRFLKAQKLPPELKNDTSLAEKILNKTGEGDIFNEVMALWERSNFKKNLIEQQKSRIQRRIKGQAGMTAIQVREHTLKKFGVEIGEEQIKQGSDGKHYFEFTDKKNPAIVYVFNPSTGEFSSKNPAIFNKETKSIDFHSNEKNLLFKIPTYTELVNKASDVRSYLGYQRPSNKEEFDVELTRNLNEKIDYKMGSVESAFVADSLEKNILTNEILFDVKKMLGLDNSVEALTQESYLAYYQMLMPVINSIQIATKNDLLVMKSFFKKSADYVANHAQHDDNTDAQKEINDSSLFKFLSSPEEKKHLQEKGRTNQKTDFGMGLLLQALEKTPDGKSSSSESNILNIEKISFLNRVEGEKNLSNDPQLGKRYQDLIGKTKKHYYTLREGVQKIQDKKAEAHALTTIENMPDSYFNS